MMHFLNQLQFLRPEWFWAVVPLLILFVLLNRHRNHIDADWTNYIDQHLLAHLSLSNQTTKQSKFLPFAVFLSALFVIIGLTGPTWKKLDVPTFSSNEPTVFVLSLAQSMNANDVAPSRLKRGLHKVRDLLVRTQGDDRALLIYSDTPFVASPLTNDAKVIEQMLPEMSTTLMPVLGDRLDLALQEAKDLMARGGALSGRVIVLADSAGENPGKSIKAAKELNTLGYQVSVLGIGTIEGATLQTADGKAITSRDGTS